MKLSVDQAIRKATSLAAKGERADAEAIFRDILGRFPANRRAMEGLRALSAPAVAQPPIADDAASALYARANALHQQGQLGNALACFDQALQLRPDFVEAHNNRGNVLKNMGRLPEALAAYDAVIRLQPAIALAHFNRGLVLKEMRRLNEALASYDEAIRLMPDLPEAHLNRGNVLRILKRLDEAVVSYDAAIRARPGYVDAHNNRGFALQELDRLDEAVASYDEAIRLKPDSAGAYNNRGSALQQLKRPIEAIASYAKALALKPDFGAALVQMLHQQALICDWSGSPRHLDMAAHDLREVPIPPTQILAIADDPALQLELAREWTNAQSPGVSPPLAATAHDGRKLKIGYFSSDYYNHATMFLMAKLFEVHDRNRFEVQAFSYGPDKQDEMQRRLMASVDQFHDVRRVGDAQVAALARREGIDIAVDLKGYTLGTRSTIFAHRAAPVQISYLGYPGTMGADFIDYIVADPVVIPPESQRFYSEKVIYLPHSYQVNDSARAISERRFKRTQCGLPENGLVFCCFNNNYKITPAEFDIWMRLLGKVEGSILWLFEGDTWVKDNLRNEAAARGIDPQRLVFAPKLANPDHLARHRCADLFLDTFNYNAHTTASDALWTGLPIVTMAGRSFAARVAASLLTAVGMPELVTDSPDTYERLALDLARDPARLKAVREKLIANLPTAPLFDTGRFARYLEAAYEAAYRRCLSGMPPAHIRVNSR